MWTWTGVPPTSSHAHKLTDRVRNWTALLGPLLLQAARQLKGQGQVLRGEWNDLRLHLQVAQQGVKLRWHLDSHCIGAFTYYAHRQWEVDWGGELFIPNQAEPLTLPKHHCWSRTYLEGVDTGLGVYIAPKPNRCVVLAPGVLHGTSRIDQDAGNAVRLAVVGFLLGDQGEGRMG